MRNLNLQEIKEILAKYPLAKIIAVENFLFTVGNNDGAMWAIANLEMDAKLYTWNAQTRAAIREGIELAKV